MDRADVTPGDLNGDRMVAIAGCADENDESTMHDRSGHDGKRTIEPMD